MHLSDLIEVICAAHLSHLVAGPSLDRGGIMLIGPPGVMKSTFLNVLDRNYDDAITMSDVNAQSLTSLRDAISTNQIRTLVLPEFGKIYERQAVTAANVEGVFRAMVGEGFSAAGWQDQRVNRVVARAMIMGALTPATQDQRFAGWENSGFNRRFLWCLLGLENPHAVDEAMVAWQTINLNVARIPRPPLNGNIPNLTTADERRILRSWVKYQPGGNHAMQLQLLSKIVSVLRWWYSTNDIDVEAMEVVGRFAVSLGRSGGKVSLPPLMKVERSTKKRVAKPVKKAKAKVRRRA